MKKYIVAAALVAAAAGAISAQMQPAGEMAAPAIKVEKMIFATGVSNREPVGEAAVFPKDTTKVYTWTKISTDQPPVKVKHVYYAEGKLVFEISLDVKASPYRVWSSKTVWPGKWKVDVTDEDGTVLLTSDFVVGEAPAAEQQQQQQ